jgi:hypothetical protein
VWSRVIVKLPMLQLKDELLEKGGVMLGVKGLIGQEQWWRARLLFGL